MHRSTCQGLLFALALLGAGVGSTLLAGNDVFVDRFQVGVTGVVVDGAVRHVQRSGEIEVPVGCGVEHSVVVEATVVGEDWVFDFAPIPDGLVPVGGGFDYTAPCEVSQAETLLSATNPALPGFQDAVAIRLITLQPPRLDGLDLSGDGAADVANVDGSLAAFEWVNGLALTVSIVGEASEYAVTLGTVAGNEWMLDDAHSGAYTLSAYRDGLTDAADGLVSRTDPAVVSLGEIPVDSGEISMTIACGEEYSAAFGTNTQGLVPTITVEYLANTALPNDSSLSPEGQLVYTPSCSPGSPESTAFGLGSTISQGGNNHELDDVVVTFTITGVEPGGPAPQLHGLDGSFDGSIDYFAFDQDGTLVIDPIEFMCGRERQLRIIGDGDSYELIDPPEFMSVNDDVITYHPDWDEPLCNDSPNGMVSELLIRAHGNGLTTDVEMTAWAMNPRIDCVTHYPGIPAGGGSQPEPVEYCDDGGDGAIDQIINLTYNISTPHEIHTHVRPSLENYTPHQTYEFEGSNIPSFMSLNVNTGVKTASPIATDEGLYSPSVKAANGGKIADWKGIGFRVVE